MFLLYLVVYIIFSKQDMLMHGDFFVIYVVIVIYIVEGEDSLME